MWIESPLRSEPERLHRAIIALDRIVLTPEDLPALFSCLPTTDEAQLLRSHIDASGSDGLSNADDFLFRMLHVPRVGPRLHALATSSSAEAGCAYLLRQLEVAAAGCDQAVGSGGLCCVLGVVLAVGNAMNEGNVLRGGAAGFGLETLSTLMSVKSTMVGSNNASTLLHYCVEQLGSLGSVDGAANKTSADTLRAELRRVPDAATIDVRELRREATRLFNDIDELAFEVEVARAEAAESEAIEEEAVARRAQLDRWCDEQLPADLWGMGDAARLFCARRFCAVLEGGLMPCQEHCAKLRAALDHVDSAYARLEAAFGEGAVMADAGGGGGGGAVPPARQILIELSKFCAALEKAEKDNARQHNLAGQLRKLRQTPTRRPITPTAPQAATAELPPMVAGGEGPTTLPALMDESRLFPEEMPPSIMAACTPPLLTRVSSAGRLSSGGGSFGGASGGEPCVRRSSSLPDSGGAAPADLPDEVLFDQAERLLSRPRPPGHNRRAGGARPSCGNTPKGTPEAVSAYLEDDDYF